MPEPQNPPFRGRRPRHPGFRRVHRLTVQLGGPEYDVIREEAERQGLAMGAAVRDFAVLAALQEKGEDVPFAVELLGGGPVISERVRA
ncbi:hypothetical protein GKE82_07505 [Conexibacter sp. W3-3-2]|uniref:hypothetical protein n=1 Tax=Conexibacter sp. W3-3-2 TaxID=2675227 RepID=UPI0012B7F90E|nr:hypothetical protein [Conexibacter sp. W3-3-2]MTD44149.1 hypothetical protein [Conexibacter sp. W3-3-2]